LSVAPTPLVLIGAGGFARETVEVVRAINAASPDGPVWDLLGYVDDDPELKGQRFVDTPVLGGSSELAHLGDAQLVVCPGAPEAFATKKKIVDRLGLPRERYATLVHPSSIVPASCSLGEGTVLLAQCVCTVDVRIGAHVGVMPQAVFTHDDVLDDYVIITAGVRLAGTVRVREGAYIGSGAVVRERRTIGRGALVGMGAVVTADVPDGEVWVGNPARFLKRVSS
jgi:sugar O-acyltransferase (sialic acid O-acetyltransferase NeuD family)